MPSRSPSHSSPIGIVGLGLMGRGIATCLLAHGLKVVGYDRADTPSRRSSAHIDGALCELADRGIVSPTRIRNWSGRFTVARAMEKLARCHFVIEAIKEDLAQKQALYTALEQVVSPEAIIASNTSSLPISILQSGRQNPQRFIGMHWGEPAQIMRYLEIIPGRDTARSVVRATEKLGHRCGKEPTVLQEDICGFLSNRMMYAMIREAFHLVESGVADIETVDRSFRNDMGWWALLAGPFRWMDLTGIPGYGAVMEGLLPKLCNATTVPRLMRQTVARGALGTANAKGFYRYTKKSARQWEKNWIDFTYDVRKLADKYAARQPAS